MPFAPPKKEGYDREYFEKIARWKADIFDHCKVRIPVNQQGEQEIRFVCSLSNQLCTFENCPRNAYH